MPILIFYNISMSPEKPASKEQLRLKDEVAIVTGGASGIGRGIALRFAQEGAKLAILDIDLPAAKRVVKQISQKDGQAQAFDVDVRQEALIGPVVDKVVKTWGQINILVNNVGITYPVSLLDTDAPDKWRGLIDTNLTSAFLVTQTVAKKMTESKWKGSIINITSVHSQIPDPKSSHYMAAKAGLVGATKCWALELAPYGIRVNAIAPGAIRNTGMNRDITDANDLQKAKELNIPLGRHGLPEEIADAAVFLATNGYITGQEVFIDGGFILTH